MTHTARATINADIQTTWDAITQSTFVKDFLPEVKKDITGMGDYIQQTHRNAHQVMPAYVIAGQTIGWNTACGTRIELPRKDTPAHIQSVDINLEEKGVYTEITIEVNYQPEIGKRWIETRRCVKGIFGIKLNVLKKDLEAHQQQPAWTPAFA